MKKLGLFLLLASSTALAGGVGAPLSDSALFERYVMTLQNYATKNIKRLPEVTNCLNGRYPNFIKPDALKLESCGIYKKGQQVYIELSGKHDNRYAFIPSLPVNTPHEEAIGSLQTVAALYEMRQKLGQPMPACNLYTASSYCVAKHESGKYKIYFESVKGTRLYYDDKKIQDWPKDAESKALSQFQNTLSTYIWGNKSSLPNIVDCLALNDGSFSKPTPLILNACGIYKSNGRTYLDIATKSGIGIFTVADGTLVAETPKQDAQAQMTVAIEQYNMRQLLGQPTTTICSSTGLSGKYCRAETEGGKVQRLYFESKDGIRLMYDGKTITDWPKE